MDRNIFIMYLMGAVEKKLIDNLPEGDTPEDRLLDYSEELIVGEFEHIKRGVAEAWLAQQKGG